jgi:hypothetical protein
VSAKERSVVLRKRKKKYGVRIPCGDPFVVNPVWSVSQGQHTPGGSRLRSNFRSHKSGLKVVCAGCPALVSMQYSK